MNRRSFAAAIGKGLGVIALAPLFASQLGCWFSNVYADLLKYVPLALSAIASVVSILTGNGIAISPQVSTVLGDIKKAFADLQVAVQNYEDAAQGLKSTLLGAIAEGITVAEASIQQFWNDLSIPDPKLAGLIEGLLGVVTTTLMGFAALLPQPATQVASAARAMRAQLAKHLPDSPTKRTPAQFKKDFNAQLATGGEQKHAI